MCKCELPSKDAIHRRKHFSFKLTFTNKISTLKQIVTALEPLMGHLEKEGIAHCDIKPSNILVQNKHQLHLYRFD